MSHPSHTSHSFSIPTISTTPSPLLVYRTPPTQLLHPQHLPSPTITHHHPPSPTITHHHPPSPTITHHHPSSPTITHLHRLILLTNLLAQTHHQLVHQPAARCVTGEPVIGTHWNIFFLQEQHSPLLKYFPYQSHPHLMQKSLKSNTTCFRTLALTS